MVKRMYYCYERTNLIVRTARRHFSNSPSRYNLNKNNHHSLLVEQDAKVASDHLVSPFWSLRALADMQKVPSKTDEVSSPLAKSKSFGFGSAAGQSRQTSISHNVANVLVNEVKYRLALQYELCVKMNQYATNGPPLTPINSDKNTNKNKRIIRAVNSPVNNTQTISDQRIMKSVVNILNDLQRLHLDTHKLIHNITSSVILQRFSNPDRFVVVSAMEQIQARHANTIENLVDIILNLRQVEQDQQKQKTSWLESLFLDQFLYERFRILLLCDHYIALDRHVPNHHIASDDKQSKNGVVHLHCPISDLLNDAISEASHLCDANLGVAPDIIIIDEDNSNEIRISSVRSNVHYVLVELLKNAMASSVERQQKLHETQCPSKVYIRIIPSEQGFIDCQIIDQGIGIASTHTLEYAWKFASSGAEERWDRLNEQQSYAMVRSPLQSLGVGLTLSRMMMRMFGGDITLTSRPESSSMIVCNRNRESHNRDNSRVDKIHLNSGCTANLRMSKDDLFVMK